MSVVSTCAITAYSVEVVRIAPASSARPRPIVRRTKSQVINTPASAASAGVRRAANSLTPKSAIHIAPSQYSSGGFST